MKPIDFHQSMIDVIDSTPKFFKLWWAMLRNPGITLAKNINSPNSHRLLPGAFLFINLLLSSILEAILYITPEHADGRFSTTLRESGSHIIGTLLLVFLLKLAFRQAKSLKLFSILCLSSIVFIPYTLVWKIISLLLAPNLRHFLLSFLSHHYENLLNPSRSTVFKLILSLALLSTVMIWWFRLLSIGCSHISNSSSRERTVRLAAAISAWMDNHCSSEFADFARCLKLLSNYARTFTDGHKVRVPQMFAEHGDG